MNKEIVTDRQIKDECEALLQESIDWSMNTFGEYKHPDDTNKGLLGKNYFAPEDIRSIGITRFLYLAPKIFQHSPKFYRDKDLEAKGKSGTYEIQEG